MFLRSVSKSLWFVARKPAFSNPNCNGVDHLGPVVQSIVSLTTLLRHQLVKYMLNKLSKTLFFLLEKYENLLHFSNKK